MLKRDKDTGKSIPFYLVLIFVLFTAGIIITGFIYYNSQKKRIFSEHQATLAAIVTLKTGQIEEWYEERMGDAAVIKDNAPLIRSIDQFLKSGKDEARKEELLEWMSSYYQRYDYGNIMLLDNELNVRLSLDNKDLVPGELIRNEISLAVAGNEPIITDIHNGLIPGYVHMDIIIPLSDESAGKVRQVGVMLLRIDPSKKLFPLIRLWPGSSLSSETLILRHEDDSVLFINELRHIENSSMKLKIALSEREVLAVKAVSGVRNATRGIDYRKIPVIGWVDEIPSVNWYIVAKTDMDEVTLPLKRYSVITIIMITLLILINGMVFIFWYWKQQLATYRDKLDAEEEIKNLNEELEQRVNRRTEQLKSANEELEAFSFSVSHDLRAPLRTINSFTNILTEEYRGKLDDEGLRICNIISESAVQMGELVDGLLAFSRIGRSSMNPVMIDMRSMAVDVFTDLAGEEDMVGINFKAGKIPKTSGDKTMIRQVWINLISNALKYTSKKKYREIIIDANYDGDMVIYSVKDNGAGFEMEYVHKLFGVFQRLHSTRDFEGNGVGLAIVQRIIMRHGGKVWAEGEVDKGAVFYFSLPLYQE